MIIAPFAAIACYGIATVSQASQLRQRTFIAKLALYGFGWLAFVFHAILLYHIVDLQSGQNLYFFNLLSLVAWLTGGLVLLLSLRQPVENLCLFLYPIALVSILLNLVFPGTYVVDTTDNTQSLFHILLAILAFSVFCIAVLQAILLVIQDSLIRSNPAAKVIHFLPPIETMEMVMFRTIAVGFILLSLLIFDAIMVFHGLTNYQVWQKTIVAVLAWIVFAALLWGRHYAGWRGRPAIYWTLAGFFCLMFAYFGTKILML